MENAFAITEEPVSVPAAAVEVDVFQTIYDLMAQRGKLEERIENIKETQQDGQRQLLLGLLEIVDALERILKRDVAHEDPQTALERTRGNVESTRRLMIQKLSAQGIRRMDIVGKVLDPHLADIDGYQENPDLPDETVVRDVISGYWWGDHVLRRAKVIVTRNI
jgi:molecular chaperone GrpE (heat shock protein)